MLKNIVAFKAELKLWMHRMEQEKMAAFPSLNEFVEKFDLHGILRLFPQHLSSFLAELDKYVLSHGYSTTFNWV